MSCGSGTVAHLHVVVAWGVVEGVGQAKHVRGETLKPTKECNYNIQTSGLSLDSAANES